jgi:hypothetical protein
MIRFLPRPPKKSIIQPAVIGSLFERYGLEMKPETVPELVQRFQLRFPGEPVTLNTAR